MDVTLLVGIISAIVTVSTILGVGLYRIISELNQRTQRIEHQITGNGVSEGVVGRLDEMKHKRKKEHKQVKDELESQAEQQEKIITAIRQSDAVNISLEQNKDNSSTQSND